MSVDLESTIKNLATQIGQDASKELADLVEDKSRLPYLDSLITKYVKYMGLSALARTDEDKKFYSEQTAHLEQTMEHVLVQERIVADAKMAAFLKRTITSIAVTFLTVAKELVSAVVSGAIKGAMGG